MNLRDLFPRLTEDNFQITSSKTIRYNCIAWAAGAMDRWWQPGVYWPIDSSRSDHGIGNLVEAFHSLGYEECDNETLEDGFEKLAFYGSGMMYTIISTTLDAKTKLSVPIYNPPFTTQ